MTGAALSLQTFGAAALATLGLVFVLAGAFGMVRFADALARLHGLRTMAYGAPFLLAAAAVEAWSLGATLQLALVGGVLAATGRTVAHLLAHAGHRNAGAPGKAP